MSGEANLPKIRSASEADAGTVAGILREAASWLDAAGNSLGRIEGSRTSGWRGKSASISWQKSTENPQGC